MMVHIGYMNKCQEILHGKKIEGGGKTHKEFDANKIKKGHKDFVPAWLRRTVGFDAY